MGWENFWLKVETLIFWATTIYAFRLYPSTQEVDRSQKSLGDITIPKLERLQGVTRSLGYPLVNIQKAIEHGHL